jgi:SAM-dependent methyltransferase
MIEEELMLPPQDLEVAATEETFDEDGYLDVNPDVARAVAAGQFQSGLQHFRAFGQKEGRRMRRTATVEHLRKAKMERLRPHLRTELPHRWRGEKVDFLSDELRAESGIVDTANVSANGYDEYALGLIGAFRDGLVLDCGAGKRGQYHANVVNFEIVDYDSTDVLGVGEVLPFKDGTFDGVLSIAVLEHVRDPFRCAAEIVRVLKPRGKLICAVPFLQPLHGYPHHYYNMTHQGLRALFERSLRVDQHLVTDPILPIWSLTWIVQTWANALPPLERQRFLRTRIEELTKNAAELLGETWVRALPAEKNFELASGTMLFATKP